jgi:hypothetical protein
LHIVQRPELAEMIDATLTRGTPEALHLPASLRVVRLCMQQLNSETLTSDREDLAAVCRPVVEIQRSRFSI